MSDHDARTVEQVREVMDWHLSEGPKVWDWAYPETRDVSITTRAMNRIDRILASAEAPHE